MVVCLSPSSPSPSPTASSGARWPPSTARGRPRSRSYTPCGSSAHGRCIGLVARARPRSSAPTSPTARTCRARTGTRQHDVAVAECAAQMARRRRPQPAWDRIARAPAPVGYDPGAVWPDGPASPDFAVLALAPWRVSAATAPRSRAASAARCGAPSRSRRAPRAGFDRCPATRSSTSGRSRTRRRSSATRRTSSRASRTRAGARRSPAYSHFKVHPGLRIPFGHHPHRHRRRSTSSWAGSARIKLGDEIVELCTWDAVRVAPELTRGIEGGPDGAELLAFGSGEQGDTQVVRDFWPE